MYTALSAGFLSQLLTLQRPQLCTLIQQLTLCTSALDSDPLSTYAPFPTAFLGLGYVCRGLWMHLELNTSKCFHGQGRLTKKHYTVRKVPGFAGDGCDGCDMVAFVERDKALSLTTLLPVFWFVCFFVCLIGACLCAVIIFQIH